MKNITSIGKEIYEFTDLELELLKILTEMSSREFFVFKTKNVLSKFFSESQSLENLKLVKSYLFQTKVGKRWHIRLTKLGHLIVKQLQS